jgi:hypothetical protein
MIGSRMRFIKQEKKSSYLLFICLGMHEEVMPFVYMCEEVMSFGYRYKEVMSFGIDMWEHLLYILLMHL